MTPNDQSVTPRGISRAVVSVIASLCLLFSACASMRVGSDHDRNASFGSYRSYTWLAREKFGGVNPLAIQRTHQAIDATLARKGFVLAPSPESADFIVDFTLGLRERLDIQSYPMGYRGPWQWGGRYYGNQIDVRQYREGTLAIDIFDGHSHQPVWSGWAQKALSREETEHSEAAVRTATAAVLQEFPPR